MPYFRFEIPEGLSYSPGWHGTMRHCPSDAEVILYNDKEGYGIAKTPDEKLPPEVEFIEEKEALGLIDKTEAGDGVYKGNTLLDKWLPEVVIEELREELGEESILNSVTVTRKAIFCPDCHQFIMWLPSNFLAATIKLTCPAGHKVVLHG